jgi:hypothetical protein
MHSNLKPGRVFRSEAATLAVNRMSHLMMALRNEEVK